MDSETCICPVRVLDDWAEALQLAAEWDASAAQAAEASAEPPAADHPPGPSDN